MIQFDLCIFLENGLVQPPTRIFLQGNSRKVVMNISYALAGCSTTVVFSSVCRPGRLQSTYIHIVRTYTLCPVVVGDFIKFATSILSFVRPCLFLCFPKKKWKPFTWLGSFKNQAVNSFSWSFPAIFQR